MPWLKLMIGAITGGATGYALYRLVGCSTGACPLLSHPWVSVMYGIVVGCLISMRI